MESSALDQLRNRRTLSDLVAAELRDRIVSGRLPMGAELNQLALTEELGVNRAAVREAFRQLEASGMIQLTPHHHAVVTRLDRRALDDLLEVRRSVESLAARRAAENLSRGGQRAEVARLQRLVDDMETETAGEAWLDLDRRFHIEICELSGNPLFRNIVDTVRVPVDRFMRTRASVEPRIESARAEHRGLVSALLSGDARLAGRLMRAHVDGTRVFLKHRLERLPADPPGKA